MADARFPLDEYVTAICGAILSLFCAGSLCALSLIALLALGWKLMLMVLVIGGCFASLASISPRPAKYAMVLGATLLLLATLLICSVARARDEARRIQTTGKLRNLGLGMHRAASYHRGDVNQAARDRARDELIESDRSTLKPMADPAAAN